MVDQLSSVSKCVCATEFHEASVVDAIVFRTRRDHMHHICVCSFSFDATSQSHLIHTISHRSWMCCYNVNNRVFSTKLKLIRKPHIPTPYRRHKCMNYVCFARIEHDIFAKSYAKASWSRRLNSLHCEYVQSSLLEYRWYDSSISFHSIFFLLLFVLCLGWFVCQAFPCHSFAWRTILIPGCLAFCVRFLVHSSFFSLRLYSAPECVYMNTKYSLLSLAHHNIHNGSPRLWLCRFHFRCQCSMGRMLGVRCSGNPTLLMDRQTSFWNS